jgi:hypothetical protein
MDQLQQTLGDALYERYKSYWVINPATGKLEYPLNRGDYACNEDWGGLPALRSYIQQHRDAGHMPMFYMEGILCCDTTETGRQFGEQYGVMNDLWTDAYRTGQTPEGYVGSYASWNEAVPWSVVCEVRCANHQSIVIVRRERAPDRLADLVSRGHWRHHDRHCLDLGEKVFDERDLDLDGMLVFVGVRVIDDQIGVSQDAFGQTTVNFNRADRRFPTTRCEQCCLLPPEPMYTSKQHDDIWCCGSRQCIEDPTGYGTAEDPPGMRHYPTEQPRVLRVFCRLA